MEEEILFRAKRADSGKWVVGYYAFDGIRHYIVTKIRDMNHVAFGHYSNHVEMYLVQPETVCQFTNYKDIKEIRIFSGDICSFTIREHGGIKHCYRGVIVHHGSRYMIWKTKDDMYFGNYAGFDLDSVIKEAGNIIVVGNIFDDREILG